MRWAAEPAWRRPGRSAVGKGRALDALRRGARHDQRCRPCGHSGWHRGGPPEEQQPRSRSAGRALRTGTTRRPFSADEIVCSCPGDPRAIRNASAMCSARHRARLSGTPARAEIGARASANASTLHSRGSRLASASAAAARSAACPSHASLCRTDGTFATGSRPSWQAPSPPPA